jgi:hypothetical protein
VAVTLLMLGLSAEAATFTGTVMMMVPKPAGEAIVQPAKVLPLLGQPRTGAPTAGIPELVLVAAITGAPLKVMPVGKMSVSVMGAVVGLPATVMVILYDCAALPTTNGPAWPAALTTVSLVAANGLETLPVQAGAVPVHSGSPPPLTVAVLFNGPTAVAPIATGTVMTMLPIGTPALIEQPVKLLAPEAGQPVNKLVPKPVAVIAPFVVTPAGKMSAKVMAANVALPATLMVI